LFRFAQSEGHIFIDGIDTKNVSLYKLRKRIAVIPQEPVLFSASLRDNLDPFHEFKDTSLWAALEDVELHKAFVPLDHPIENGGKNLRLKYALLILLSFSQKLSSYRLKSKAKEDIMGEYTEGANINV
jgi:ATP-binding cassette subfamily C (CFTR/MRP) protein 4